MSCPRVRGRCGHAPRAIASPPVNSHSQKPRSPPTPRTSALKSPTCAHRAPGASSTKTPPSKAISPGASSSAHRPAPPHPRDRKAGPDPAKMEERALGPLQHRRSQQRPHRSHQRNHRTGQKNRQRLPQPHQLQTPHAPHHRRPRHLHPHSTMKSRKTGKIRCSPQPGHGLGYPAS